MADLEDIRSRLEAIAEELADAALDRLRESVVHGADVKEERIITRARRAVERAAHLLSGAGPGAGDAGADD